MIKFGFMENRFARVVGALMLCSWCQANVSSDSRTLFVSPNGDDNNTGSKSEPLASLTGARNRIRTAKQSGAWSESLTVQFADGVYEITEPVIFGPEDSGTAEAPVIYRAEHSGKAMISGGIHVAGWREKEPGVWAASMGNGREFYQLFINGERRQRARTPNRGYLKSFGPARPVANFGALDRKDLRYNKEFRYRDGDFQNWPDLADALVVSYHSWLVSVHWIDRIDPSQGIVYMRNPAGWPFGKWDNQQERYSIENVKAAFDAPGEWYLDKAAGELLYRPLPGEAMANAEVIVPVAQRLLELEDVEHLAFEGLSFRYSDWRLDKDRYRNQQAFPKVDSTPIFGRKLRNTRFENCEIALAGAHAMVLRAGCQYNIVRQCHIHDMAGGGVYIGASGFVPDGTPDAMLSYSNTVDNCFIHHLNHTFHGAVGIFIGMASGSRITHNDISEFDYTGISVGWTWRREGNTYHHDNLIENNHVHHLMQGVLSDGGGIYTAGYYQKGTVIRGNVVHDVYHHPTHCNSKGIYLDGCSSDILVENNLCYNISSFGIQAKGERNIVRNNIFAFCGETGISRVKATKDSVPLDQYKTNVFEHNIVYLSHDLMTQGLLMTPLSAFDSNLYWNSTASGDVRFFPQMSERSKDNRSFSFKELQATGQDVHSLVADPGFVNPDRRDFRLKVGSAALVSGFIPHDFSEAGLYGGSAWTSLPAQLTYRPIETIDPEWQEFHYDFEDHYTGMNPMTCWMPAEKGDCTVRISDARAASGSKSVLFQDGADAPSYFPMMTIANPYTAGRYRLSMQIWNDPASPALISVQTRSHMGAGYLIGADIGIQANGALVACGKKLCTVPFGEWVLLELTFGGGAGNAATYNVAVILPDASRNEYNDLPVKDGAFEKLGWVGIIANGRQGRFYLDDLQLNEVR
ncbi:right-handed parallel beta-helix repeat-containing protein [Pontiella sulfatireligans]|uniref:Right handed beta helix domain-containing protein n=1 Tax=Pontiella sulfatireligans TaxID=2750658 RepID=A0A6C2UNM5_9BACT|nr:right-handed parallel beta-helix repeat-containing protein [Pontiella sulfatireligans]VGO20656.1 hypothetical protein SCARR_02722 [Pontiella sulfatireligans]